jgi:hypothetical protein
MTRQKLIYYSILFIAIADGLLYMAIGGFNDNFYTTVAWGFKYIALFIFIYIARRSSWKSDGPTSIFLLLRIFLLWNVVTIIRGMILSVDYWDWKFLIGSSLLFFLIPIAFFTGKNILIARLIFRFVIRYLFLFGFLIVPLALVTNHELYSRLMIPISVFILFIPYVKFKDRILILLVAVVSILIVIDFRTNVIKIVISMILLLAYHFRAYILPSWLKIAHAVIFILPFVFLYLAVSGQYNVFAETGKSNYTVKSGKSSTGDDINLAADTRTFLYVDVFSTLNGNGNMIMGEGATGKYKTDVLDFGDKRGRYGSEVGFLNILLYSGIVGLVLYLLILFIASYYAIYRSNNFLCKMLGLLIAGRWLIFFIEEFTFFDLNTLFTWLVIGLICSQEFRSMSEKDLKAYFRI